MTISSINPATGGPARSVPSLSKAVSKLSGKITLFVKNESEIEYSSNLSTDSSIPAHSMHTLNSNLQKLKKTIVQNKIIHNHGIWLPINHRAATIARRYQIPYIISPRGMLEPWAFSLCKWKKKLAWHLYQKRDLQTASLLHATAPQEAASFRALGLRPPIAVIPNGVDLPQQIQSIVPSNKTKTAIFLSRIHPIKGLLNLAQAWSQAAPKNWQVIIAGPDEDNHKQEVEQKIKRLGLNDVFSFIGSVKDDDKWVHYNKADLFILPTFSENFGIVIAEALASGTPVITTKGTPWAELETHNCGWWIDIGVEPLAQAIAEATNLSPETRFKMGQRGRQLVTDKYSWDTIAQDMISVYEWVLHGGTPPECVIID